MENLEQQGIAKRWLTGRKGFAAKIADWVQSREESDKKKILDYIRTGQLPDRGFPTPDVVPPMQPWDGIEITDWLYIFGLMRVAEVEAGALKAKQAHFDGQRAHD